jgi:hypothetical protein
MDELLMAIVVLFALIFTIIGKAVMGLAKIVWWVQRSW